MNKQTLYLLKDQRNLYIFKPYIFYKMGETILKHTQNFFVFIRNVLFKTNILNSNFQPKNGYNLPVKTFTRKRQKTERATVAGPLNH